MSAASLAVVSILTLGGAVLLARVGVRFAARRTGHDIRRAALEFTAWWIALAATLAVGAAQGLVAATASVGVAETFARASNYVYVLAVCVALWGLLSHIAFLFTGRDASRGIGAFYAAVYLLAAYDMLRFPPDVLVGEYAVSVAASHGGVPLQVAFLLVFLAPQLAGVLAYAALWRKTQRREARYRIALVAPALLLWMLSPLVAGVAGVSQAPAWVLASRCIAIAASFVILAAYEPPTWIRRRYRLDEPLAARA